MSLKYAIYGAFFGWFLMPRWRGRSLKIPATVIAYAVALLGALAISYFFEFVYQSWIFVMGMTAQLAAFAVLKWGRYFFAKIGRRADR